MATNKATGSIIAHNRAHGTGWVGYATDTTGYAGSNYSEYNTYLLKFTTPAFVGVSESVAIKLGIVKNAGDPPTLRYALCTSDANKASYCNTYSAVSDAYQIETGTKTFEGLSSGVTYHTITIPTAKLKPSTTYYLFLWAYTPTSNPNHIVPQPLDYTTPSVVVGYNQGIAYIGEGAYQWYVGNGTSYDLFIPGTGNGSDWDIMS